MKMLVWLRRTPGSVGEPQRRSRYSFALLLGGLKGTVSSSLGRSRWD
jgi:hypothetical protein